MSASAAPPPAPGPGAASRVRWRLFGLVAVLTVINLADRTSIAVGMPTIAAELALSPAFQGVVLSAFFWSYAFCQLPGGLLIDRLGPSRVVAGATVLWGLFQTLTAAAWGGVTLLLARVGLGVSEAPLFPAGGKLNALWLAPTERARGAVIMDSGSYLGAGLGGAAIAFLIDGLDSWRLAFAVAGLATVLLGLLAWRWLHDDPARHPGVNAAELAAIRTPEIAPAELGEGAARRLTPRLLVPLMLGRFAWATINFGLLTWGPSFLAQARGFDLKAMGSATLVIFGGGFAGALASGFLADALQRRGLPRALVLKLLLALSGLAVLAAFVILPGIESPPAVVALLTAADVMLCFGSLYWSFPAMLAPAGQEGTAGGLMNLAGSVGGIVVPLAAGLILQLTGSYAGVLIFFAGAAALYVAGTLLIPFEGRQGGGA